MPPATANQGLAAVVPQQFNTQIITHAVEPLLMQLAQEALEELKKTVEDWEEQVEFRIEGPHKKGSNWEVTVGTDNEIWGWVDAGTAEHPIVAKDAPLLRFQATPAIIGTRTRPGSFSSGFIHRESNWSAKKSVIHPGIEPRGWSEMTAQKMQDDSGAAFTSLFKKGWATLVTQGRPASPPESACFKPGHGC